MVADPVVKALGTQADTLNNNAGRFVLMESRDGSYFVEHQVAEEAGTAAKRADHLPGAYTQAVAVRQDGNLVVFRNQQSKRELGNTVNQLEINGQVVPLDQLKQAGTLPLPNGGEVRWSAPTAKIPEGTIRVISAKGDVLRIEDKGPYIDLYGTPSTAWQPGELAGMAGANSNQGAGFYQRMEVPTGRPGWESVQRVTPDEHHNHHANAALVDSWRADAAEDVLGGNGAPAGAGAALPAAVEGGTGPTTASVDANSVAAPAAGSTYKVVANDSLAKIARKQLGDESRANELIALNQAKYPSLAKPPHVIQPGWTLQLPAKN